VSISGVVVLGAAHIHMSDLARIVRSHPDVRVVSVWDHDPGRAERWASALDAHACADLDVALDAEALHGALVYSETSRHRHLVSAAARRGLAVFVEKPLAASQTDAVAMSEALAGNRLFSTGFFLRYADAFLRLRHAVANGDVGPVHRAAVRVVHGGLRQGWFDGEHAWMRERAEGGGGFFDLVIHCLDVAAWVLGPIEQVSDVRLHESGHHGVAVVHMASGVAVEMEAGWEASTPDIQMTVTDDRTTLTATGGRLLAGSTAVATGRPPDAGDPPRAWLDALANRAAQPLVSLDDAVDRVRATDELRRLASTDARRRSQAP
jgi:predicted dehydrogenase